MFEPVLCDAFGHDTVPKLTRRPGAAADSPDLRPYSKRLQMHCFESSILLGGGMQQFTFNEIITNLHASILRIYNIQYTHDNLLEGNV